MPVSEASLSCDKGMHIQWETTLPMVEPCVVFDSQMSQVASKYAASPPSTDPSSAVSNAFLGALSICRRARPERHFRTYSHVLSKNRTTQTFRNCNSHSVSCRKQRCSGEVGVKLRFTHTLPACQGSQKDPFGPLCFEYLSPPLFDVYSSILPCRI